MSTDVREAILAEIATHEDRVAKLREMLLLNGEAPTARPAPRPAPAPTAPPQRGRPRTADASAPEAPPPAARKRGKKKRGKSGGGAGTGLGVTLEQVEGILKPHKEGLRAEEIREALGLPSHARRTLTRLFMEGVRAKRMRHEGQLRARRYFVVA